MDRQARLDHLGHFIKSAIPASVRRDLATRHGCMPGSSCKAKCSYCNFLGEIHWITQPTDRGPGWVSFVGLEMDHVIPEFDGGSSDVANIALACRPCNRSKSYKSREQWLAGKARK